MKPTPSTYIAWAVTVVIAGVTLLAAFILGGCLPEPRPPESEAWRTAPPINLPDPMMERCWKADTGEKQCECISPHHNFYPIMCYDEV